MKSQPSTSSKRPRVFIGSSTEGLQVSRALQADLYHDAEPILWSQGVFGLSAGTLESLVNECNNFDFAVFVLSPDDLIRRRNQRGNAPRDNVLFELGLFMGRLGRERTFFVYCAKDPLMLPSDLAGVTAATYLPPSEPRYLQAAVSAASTPILAAIQTLGTRVPAITESLHANRVIDELRIQVGELKLMVSSFAKYAQSLPIVDRASATRDKAAASSSLDVLQGTWKSDPTESTAWCIVKGGKAKFLYSYRGDGPPTGEYFGFRRTGNALSGRFFWFDKDAQIHGYGWFEIVGEHRLEGGWWFTSDVPRRLVSKLPDVPRMVPLKWERVSSMVSRKAMRFFRQQYPDPPSG